MAESALPKVDEFAFVMLAGLLMIFVMMFVWTTPTEGPPILDQQSYALVASPGDALKVDFDIHAVANIASINLTASSTDVSSKWITFSKNDFSVSNVTTATATIRIPRNVPFGVYNSRITVTGIGGTASFTVSINVGLQPARQVFSRPVPQSEFPSDFSVSYAKGTDNLDTKTDVDIYSGYLSSRAVTLMGLVSTDRLDITTGGSIIIDVKDTNGLGNVIVLLNDVEVYNRNVGVGEILVPINKSDIQRSNTITVKAGTPGWAFWTNTIYNLGSVKFNIDYQGIFSQSFNFTLTKDEVTNFKDLGLFYRVQDHSENMPDMIIKVNNQIVYLDHPSPILFDRPFSEDMFGSPLYLNEGTNSITFLFEKNAQYTVSDAMLKVESYV
jgi:hypothetical protein